MSVSVLQMSMSLDGYVAAPDDLLGGADGNRLHEWYRFTPDFHPNPTEAARPLTEEGTTAGAIVVGRRTAELVDHWDGDHHGAGIPIFVPSHRPPGPTVAGYPLVTYVNDGITSTMTQAKAAAGDRNVMVLGGYTAQRALEAGVLDELQIHQIPVILGRGRRLFQTLSPHIELDILHVIDTPDATHIRYRVRR